MYAARHLRHKSQDCRLRAPASKLENTHRFGRTSTKNVNLSPKERAKEPVKKPSRETRFQLPNYIEAPQPHITDGDIQYLCLKGVMRFPSTAIREKLWKAYFLLVHPVLPIVDRESVLRSIHSDSSGPKISLLLFYCVMSTAQLFLNAQEERDPKSPTPDSMFEKARVLYDLQWETNTLTLLQSVLLMTLFPRPIDEVKNPSHWIVQAMSLAYKLDLHRSPCKLAISERKQSLQKQIWWSVYIRGHLLSFDSGTPWIIYEEEVDVPMLTLDDFALVPLLPSPDAPGLLSTLDCVSQQRRLAILFIERCKLASLLGRLPPISNSKMGWTGDTAEDEWPQLPLKAPTMSELDRIDDELHEWFIEVSPKVSPVQASSLSSTEVSRQSNDLVSLNYDAILLFHRIVCHHAAVLRCLQSVKSKDTLSEHAFRNLSVATESIVSSLDKSTPKQLATCTQLNGLSVIRPILLWNVINSGSPDRTYPSLGPDYIHSLLDKVREYDTWAQRAVPYTVLPSDTLYSTSSDTESDQPSPKTPTSPPAGNMFDVYLGDLGMVLNKPFFDEEFCDYEMLAF
jgi:hypothetical protein